MYQDTFLKAMELLDRIDYRNNPKSYLLSKALRLWKNKRRKAGWRTRIAQTVELGDEANEVPGNESLPEEELIRRERDTLVRQKVADLEEKYRIPIYLFYAEQLSVEEISRILKLPQGTVQTRLYKARKLLQKELEVVL